ncbi:MAG: PEP-utilizing enzyme, partial [Propionibacteriaceae bacterium]
LRGRAASAGRALGKARIIRGPAEFGDLEAGDVLVCPFTDPTWTPLFALASAVVADSGGPLSHAAIVAREYGIPAVLGMQHATATIPNGARVLVDGTAGVVKIQPDAGA